MPLLVLDLEPFFCITCNKALLTTIIQVYILFSTPPPPKKKKVRNFCCYEMNKLQQKYWHHIARTHFLSIPKFQAQYHISYVIPTLRILVRGIAKNFSPFLKFFLRKEYTWLTTSLLNQDEFGSATTSVSPSR